MNHRHIAEGNQGMGAEACGHSTMGRHTGGRGTSLHEMRMTRCACKISLPKMFFRITLGSQAACAGQPGCWPARGSLEKPPPEAANAPTCPPLHPPAAGGWGAVAAGAAGGCCAEPRAAQGLEGWSDHEPWQNEAMASGAAGRPAQAAEQAEGMCLSHRLCLRFLQAALARCAARLSSAGCQAARHLLRCSAGAGWRH